MPRKKINPENEAIQDIKPIEKAAQKVPVDNAEKKEMPKKEEEKVAGAEKETVKKSSVKKAAESKPAAKKEIKVSSTLQFGGKAYTEEDLVKIAKDVWRYDLKRKLNELQSIELYVKPEENMVYYVINKTEAGSFNI